MTNVEGGGAICLPQCGVGKGKCPTDEPSGMTAKPDCFHSQKGKKFCIPMCSSASDCGTMGSCNSKGECTYTGPSGPTTPTPAPGPSPPTPAPAPPSPTPAPGPGPKPPKIPLQYTADITSVTKGDIPNLPRGTQVYSEAYDYGNKRRRVDVTQGQGQGTKKIYRYDVKDDGHNPFPAPRGYQIGQNPKIDCCWLWLIDTSDPTNTTNLEMDEVQVPPKATDEGACTIDGKAAEHWHAKGGVVVLESQSDWYLGPNASIIQQNSQFRLKLKTALSSTSRRPTATSASLRRWATARSSARTPSATCPSTSTLVTPSTSPTSAPTCTAKS